MAIKGLEGFRYSVIKSDTTAGTEYSEIKRLIGARNIKISPKVNTGELYGDGVLMATASAVSSIEVEIDVCDLTLEEKGELLGYKYENGVLIEGKSFTPPEIAFGFQAPKSNDKLRMKWLLRGKVEPVEEEAKTQEDKVEFQTQKIKIKFMPRVSDGETVYTADEDIEGAPTPEEFFTTDFLKTGKKPDLELRSRTGIKK